MLREDERVLRNGDDECARAVGPEERHLDAAECLAGGLACEVLVQAADDGRHGKPHRREEKTLALMAE